MHAEYRKHVPHGSLMTAATYSSDSPFTDGNMVRIQGALGLGRHRALSGKRLPALAVDDGGGPR